MTHRCLPPSTDPEVRRKVSLDKAAYRERLAKAMSRRPKPVMVKFRPGVARPDRSHGPQVQA